MKKVCNLKPSHLLIVGDFNIKDINWVDITSDAIETHTSTRFIECIRDCFLFQHVLEPTRYRTDNVLSISDLVLTNGENMILNLSNLPGLGKSEKGQQQPRSQAGSPQGRVLVPILFLIFINVIHQ